MRSRALTPASPPGSQVLRYAFQFVCFEPAALASALQCASAPSMPPKSAPLPLPTLVTKNVMSPLDAVLGLDLSCACAPVTASANAINAMRFISPPGGLNSKQEHLRRELNP